MAFRCILMPKFDAGAVWSHLLGVGLGPDEQQRQPTVFMGVPTMYAKLLDEYDRTYASNPTKREYLKAVCSNKIRSVRLQERTSERQKKIPEKVLVT